MAHSLFLFKLVQLLYGGVPLAVTGEQEQKQIQREEHVIVCVSTNGIT